MSSGMVVIFVLSTAVICLMVLILPLPVTLAITLLTILLSDADLTLMGCSVLGKKPREIRGQVIWITGASSGIGEELAYKLSTLSCKLILSARREDELERVRRKCTELSPLEYKDAHMVMKLDLTDFDSHLSCVQEVLDKYNQIDCLVNNAGRTQIAPAMKTSLEVDKSILNLNTVGTISLTKAVLPHMIRQKKGLIVTISSAAGKYGVPNYAVYSASKHALQGYFDALRMELVDTGVDVLNVCPGPVESRVLDNACSDHLDKPPPTIPPKLLNFIMPGQRCAYLMTVAMANRLHEVWISRSPIIFSFYIAQYLPDTLKWLGVVFIGRTMKRLLAD